MPRQGLGEFFGVTFLKNASTIGSLTSSSKIREDDGRREKTRQEEIDLGPGPWGRGSLANSPSNLRTAGNLRESSESFDANIWRTESEDSSQQPESGTRCHLCSPELP